MIKTKKVRGISPRSNTTHQEEQEEAGQRLRSIDRLQLQLLERRSSGWWKEEKEEG